MCAEKIVAIHQPNFFPWLGYFDKIARADVFILMDNAQFPKKGGTWTNRVQLVVNGKANWATIPVNRSFHGVRLIRDMLIDSSTPWRNKLLTTVQINYAHAPFFDKIFPFFRDLLNNPTENLADYNKTLIRTITSEVGLEPSRLLLGSSLGVEGTATDLLIAMTRVVGGTAYLCGGGAAGYQEDDKFASAGIKLIYQNFEHPVYKQVNTGDFVRGLSIVDALLNCGTEGVRDILHRKVT